MIATLDLKRGEVACMVQAAHVARLEAKRRASLKRRRSAVRAELRHQAARFALLERSLLRLQAEWSITPGLVLQLNLG